MLESASGSSSHSPPHAPRFELALRAGGGVAIPFVALGSRCELLLDAADGRQALELGRAAALEAWRIESKFRFGEAPPRRFCASWACRTGACDRHAYG
jgi:hypothetical protein